MVFGVFNQVSISGGDAAERRSALRMLAASDFGAEPPDEAEAREAGETLGLRFQSVDLVPEEELRAVARNFPTLRLVLLYVSIDGEFLGRLSGSGEEIKEESLDFDEGETRRLEALDEERLFDWARSRLG